MSLFSELQRLYRTDRFLVEDPHTEIVAQVLRNSESLTLAWLQELGVTTLEKAKIDILTQERFELLPGHSSLSRPDITIRLKAAGKSELIFIESKLPSTQGDDQLQRYADHLASEFQTKGLSRASLIFITRDYEAAETPIVKNSQFQPKFVATRWFQFYQHLKDHVNGDGLARELKLFMEENRMSLGNQFKSTDMVALENFLSARALMNETLDGEVTAEAKRVLGEVEGAWKIAAKQLRDRNRYIIANGNWNVIECLIGYWLPYETTDDGVWVGITLHSNPNATARAKVIEAFRKWVENEGNTWSIDEEDEWCPVYKGKTLQYFLSEPDHVRAIKNYFVDLLKEVELFRKSYPEAPWA